MKSELQPSLSVYRGQSRAGIGEGPGKPIARGEQYLRADAPLDNDVARLREMRPWMSLDADSADVDRLGQDLEAWSCFTDRGLGYVVRLVPAGIFDRRHAYFAHGRAWPEKAFLGPMDPGAHLGRAQAFERPWRDEDLRTPVSDVEPAMVRPRQVESEQSTAIRFLAHMLQARVEARPLVIAAPIDDFVAGNPLYALISAARAALPADLKVDFRMRIYTRNPELFLRHCLADVLVVPEAVAESSQTAGQGVTLIDRFGKIKSGREPDPLALNYAEAVVERACKIPQSLLAFSSRFAHRRQSTGLPDDDDVRSLQITYNVAFAMTGSQQRLDGLLQKYLFKKAGELGPLPWNRLIESREWEMFSRRAILDSLLQPISDPGGRSLQDELEEAAGRLGLTVDTEVDPAWADDAVRLERLADLASHQPPLVSTRLVTDGILSRLPVRALLSLADATRGRFDDGLRRIFTELDRRIADQGRLEETIEALIQFGWWYFWRCQSRLPGSALRAAAIAWAACGAWNGAEAPEATLETWELVLGDLADPPVSGTEMAGFCRGEQPSWPWITPFESEQLAGMARVSGDLGALAELAETVAFESLGLEPATAMDHFVLERSSGLAQDLPAGVLSWLSLQPLVGPPSLTLAQAHRLIEACGHRQEQAERAKVQTILAHLDMPDGAPAALAAAGEEPDLWRQNQDFLDGLAEWMLRQGSLKVIGREVADVANARLMGDAEHGSKLSPRRLAGELEGEFSNLSAFLRRCRQHGIAPHVEDNISPVRGVIDALASGDVERSRSELDVLFEHYREPFHSSELHPLRAVVAEIRGGELLPEEQAALGERGWKTFDEAARGGRTRFLQEELPRAGYGVDTVRLPAFELALAVSRPGMAGHAVTAVIFAHGSRPFRSRSTWWRALLHGIRDFRRFGSVRCVDDRADVALRLLFRATARLGSTERRALEAALRDEAASWPLISQFGVRAT